MIKTNKKQTLYFFGEILMRLEATKNTNTLNSLDVFIGGSEYNSAIACSGLGNNVSMISLLPSDSFITNKIISYTKSFGVDTKHIKNSVGNQGIYFVERNLNGNSSVVYNREKSSFVKNTDILKNMDFGKEKDILHISGISLVLSEKTFETSLKLIQQSKEKGMLISFDFNYRSKLTNYKIAKERYAQILEYADLIFATKRDFVCIFNYDENMSENEIFKSVFSKYKNLEYIAHTNRSHIDEKDALESVIYHKGNKYTSSKKTFKMVGRIGGGDAFAAGVIDGISNNLELNDTIERANSLAVYKQSSFVEDVIYINNEELNSFIENDNEKITR